MDGKIDWEEMKKGWGVLKRIFENGEKISLTINPKQDPQPYYQDFVSHACMIEGCISVAFINQNGDRYRISLNDYFQNDDIELEERDILVDITEQNTNFLPILIHYKIIAEPHAFYGDIPIAKLLIPIFPYWR